MDGPTNSDTTQPKHPEPRAHHFLPKFYLAGFTQSGTKDGRLWVRDITTRKRWGSTPNESAHIRDFNRVETEHADPFFVEKILAGIENQLAPALKEVLCTEEVPTGERLDVLLNLITLLAVRVPVRRAILDKFMDGVGKAILHYSSRTPEEWSANMDGAGATKQHSNPASFEKMKEFVDGGQYTISLDQTSHIRSTMKSAATLFPILAARQWALVIADDEAAEFICSDNPVVLSWTKEPTIKAFPPAFGMPDTAVMVPLSRRILAYGTFEDFFKIIKASPEHIADFNRCQTAYAQRFIYSCREDFLWLKEDKTIGNADDCMAAIQRKVDAEGESP